MIDTVSDLVEVLGGERYIVIARELTKTFETIYSDTADNILAWLNDDPNQLKGEMVLIIEGAKAKEQEISSQVEHALKLLLKELPPKKACAIAAEIYQLNKKSLYELALSYK